MNQVFLATGQQSLGSTQGWYADPYPYPYWYGSPTISSPPPFLSSSPSFPPDSSSHEASGPYPYASTSFHGASGPYAACSFPRSHGAGDPLYDSPCNT